MTKKFLYSVTQDYIRKEGMLEHAPIEAANVEEAQKHADMFYQYNANAGVRAPKVGRIYKNEQIRR